MEYKNNVKEFRLKQKLTQEELANKTNIDRAHLSLIENGKIDTRISTAVKIARALDVEIGKIF